MTETTRASTPGQEVAAGLTQGEGEGPAVAPRVAGERNAYTAMQVVARTGATYRQVDYWARIGLVEPSIASALGSGTQRAYSPADLWRVAIVKTLLDAGLSLAAVREVIDEACEHEHVLLTERVHLDVRHAPIAKQVRVEPPTHLRLVES